MLENRWSAREGRDASRFHRVEPPVSRMFAALYLVALLYVIFEVLQFCGTTMGGFPPRPLAAKKRASNFAFLSPTILEKSLRIPEGCCALAGYIG